MKSQRAKHPVLVEKCGIEHKLEDDKALVGTRVYVAAMTLRFSLECLSIMIGFFNRVTVEFKRTIRFSLRNQVKAYCQS